MSSAKDKGSSRRKGKEVAADDPHAKAMGEETPLFESNHSGEDERGHDLTSECPPLHRSMARHSHSLPYSAQ